MPTKVDLKITFARSTDAMAPADSLEKSKG